MSYIDEILERALLKAKKRIKEESMPYEKYLKRVRNRDKLYQKRLKAGIIRPR